MLGMKAFSPDFASCESFVIAYIVFMFCVNSKQEQEIVTPEAQCLTNLRGKGTLITSGQ